MLPKIAALLMVAALLAACGDGSGGSRPAYDFSAFEAEVAAFVAEQQLAGAGAVLVDREHGVVFQKSFGSFSDDRIYLLASSSKMISAGVLLRLADDGLLDLDAPVADLVDWGAANPAITPAQLVSNSSGLVGLEPSFAPYLCQYVHTGTLQDCAATLFTTPADDARVIPPDTQFRYGGAQWQVAGAVAEIASGRSWSELIREIYVEPCGLETLGFNNHFVQPGISGGNPLGYPPGFDSNPANLLPTENPNPEGGGYASIGDYAKLLLMHLRGGLCDDNRVLTEDSIRLMQRDRIASYGGSTATPFEGYGMGWWIDRDTGVIYDPGAYGAVPWIDQNRGYAGFLALESRTDVGIQLLARVESLAAAAIDTAQ